MPPPAAGRRSSWLAAPIQDKNEALVRRGLRCEERTQTPLPSTARRGLTNSLAATASTPGSAGATQDDALQQSLPLRLASSAREKPLSLLCEALPRCRRCIEARPLSQQDCSAHCSSGS